MEKVEADLSRSKSLREKQSKEFSWQLEELKQRYEQQVSQFAPSGGGRRDIFSCRCRSVAVAGLILFSLCGAVLCVKTKFIGMQSLCDGGWKGKSLHRKYFCFLFAILCTSDSFKLFPRLTGGNTYFHKGQMTLFNALSVFLLVKKQHFILFIIFNMASVHMNACFGPLIVTFFIVM